MDSIADVLYTASVWVLPVLLAVTLHEAAHGFAAYRLGDPTAKLAGRLSLNPLRHVDPVGTVILPAILLLTAPFVFGWAKPVPVDFRALRHPRSGMVWVALAGPGTNVALALAAAVGMRWLLATGDLTGSAAWVALNLENLFRINLILAVFNMLPLPPLDGGRVAVGILPRPLAIRLARVERFGFLILIGFVFLLPMLGNQLGLDLDVFQWVVGVPAQWLAKGLLGVAGF